MKKLIYFVIAVMFLSAMPEIVRAQSNDPFEQQTLKARDNTTKREKKINRKKTTEVEEKQDQQPAHKAEPKQKPAKNNEFTISNPCDEWLDLEIVSIIGSKGSQKVKITGKITNHEKNMDITVGRNFVCYDSEGNEHNSTYYGTTSSFNTLSDVPVKFSIEIPGTIKPSETKILPVVSFNINDCRIEMRNVPINWK